MRTGESEGVIIINDYSDMFNSELQEPNNIMHIYHLKNV